MQRNDLFTIGEFSAITGVGIYSLRYYDQIGALKPEYVDPVSNYRYYGYRQLSRIPAISICKDAGIKLSEFDSFLVDGAVDYDKLLEESRRSIGEIIDSCRLKERGLDKIEEFCTIISGLSGRQTFTAAVRSLDVWSLPYDDIDVEAGSPGMLVKLSESAAKCGVRIMPSAYGILRVRKKEGCRDYAFAMPAEPAPDIPDDEHRMIIPGGKYIFAAMESLSPDEACGITDAQTGDCRADQVLSLALITGGASAPLYCAAAKVSG